MIKNIINGLRWTGVVLLPMLLTSPLVLADAADQAKPVRFDGVWQMADYALTVRAELNNPKFTEQAQRWQDDFRRERNPSIDDPNKFCVLKGMPWTMTSRARGYPTEIYQTETHIFMIFEGSDTHRVIYLNREDFPSVGPSSNGFSIGKWEGNSLVIRTRGLLATSFPNPYMRSEQAEIIERWQLRQQPEFGEIMEVDLSVTDPEIYLEPAKGRQVWRRAPAGTTAGGYNCTQAIWDEYITRRQDLIRRGADGVNARLP